MSSHSSPQEAEREVQYQEDLNEDQRRGRASLVAHKVMQCSRTQVRSLGQEDPLEKGMANHSRILACMDKRSPRGHSSWGCKELDMSERLTHRTKGGETQRQE